MTATPNRAQRRACRAMAGATAAVLARHCYDHHAGQLVQVTHPAAVAALARAFKRMVQADCQPLAVPLSQAEAQAFPRHKPQFVQAGVTWLAVGLDLEGRGSYAMQTAIGPDRAQAHDVARASALADLARLTARRGFPMDKPDDKSAFASRR